MTVLPSVGVVLATRDRPRLLRRALDAVLAQDYQGQVRAAVVFDQVPPDESLRRDGEQRRVDVLTNDRTPGLAGARNTGILALDTDLVAFCDDDDTWLPDKLSAQVTALQSRRDAEFASCSIVVEFGDRSSVRLAGQSEIRYADLVRSRMSMVHPSTYVIRRAAFMNGLGILDETIPGSQNEDWDIALRAARRHRIVHVDRPLVRVLFGRTSFFFHQWDTKIASLEWMLRRHPDIGANAVGAGRVYGQLAFAHAALGRRGTAGRWAVRALRTHPRERRAFVALAVAGGLVSAETVLGALHRRGHGV